MTLGFQGLTKANVHFITGEKSEPENFDCLRGAVDAYEKHCQKLGDYGMGFV